MPRRFLQDIDSDNVSSLSVQPPSALGMICSLLDRQVAREQELSRDELNTLTGLINRNIDPMGLTVLPRGDVVIPVGELPDGSSACLRSINEDEDGGLDASFAEAAAIRNEVEGIISNQGSVSGEESEADEEGDPFSGANIMWRLRQRRSRNHALDFDLLLDSNFHFQTQGIRDAASYLASARSRSDEPITGIDDVDPQTTPEGASSAGMTTDVPQTDSPTQGRRSRVVLPHLYLPGWQGSSSSSDAAQWELAIRLADGRFWLRGLPYRDGHPTLPEAYVNLGFPNARTFCFFIYRNDVKAAFRELWDDCLVALELEDDFLADCSGNRYVSARIFYARCLPGCSAYETVYPDKTGWQVPAHLTRFALKIEVICDKWLLPPLRGQIPILPQRLSALTVAWGGVELARILRRLQKGYGSFEGAWRYLD